MCRTGKWQISSRYTGPTYHMISSCTFPLMQVIPTRPGVNLNLGNTIYTCFAVHTKLACILSATGNNYVCGMKFACTFPLLQNLELTLRVGNVINTSIAVHIKFTIV